MAFAPWQAPTHCTDGPTPGARALAKWCKDDFGHGYSMGIFNCRPVRGGSTTSTHGEGRALDWGFELVDGKPNPLGTKLVHMLRVRAKELGIQCIIWNRRIWSAKSPSRLGRYYGGVNPHYDHLHIELTRNAAANLTLATLRHWLSEDVKPEPVVAASPPRRRRHRPGSRVLKVGMRGYDVKVVQKFLGKLEVDGHFGEATQRRVRVYQSKRGLNPTGRVGPHTWVKILAEIKA